MKDRIDTIWQSWANRLQQLGLHQVTEAVLQATGPINLVGAQMVYLGQPLLNTLVDDTKLTALAKLLEDSEQTEAFLSYLQEDRA